MSVNVRTFNVEDLVEQGWVRKKTYDNGLSVLKYHNKVFYKNLWSKDKRLLDCRGIVVDSDDNIVVYPFTKVFNLGENGTSIPSDTSFVLPEKINGFMAAASMWNGELIVSTTGTLDSDYAMMARRWITKDGVPDIPSDYTVMFEICDKSDPHIVNEQEGAYLIGCRKNVIGSDLLSERQLDKLNNVFTRKSGTNYIRPPWSILGRHDLLISVRNCQKEGVMVRDIETGKTLCKIKSPHYLTKKFFMRMSPKNIEKMYDKCGDIKQRVDEEYYDLLEYIQGLDKEMWENSTDNERKEVIEEWIRTR